MCLNWLKSKLCKQGNISPPNFLEDVSGTEVLSILKAEFPNATIIASDLEYKTTTKEELKRFLKYDITDSNRWTKYYNCNNFAFQLMGNISNPDWGVLSFGILLGKKNGKDHAINCFIDNNREVFLVEPQNDSLTVPSDAWDVIIILM